MGIDTSTKFLCLGFQLGDKLCAYNLEAQRRLCAILAPTIKRVLEAQGLALRDIDYFAAGLGPGSFTGLRVGLAAIKALSLIHKRPVAGIPTLDILAKNAGETKRMIVPALDARRGLIYCAFYKNTRGQLMRKSPHMLISLKEFLKRLDPHALVFGDAVGLYRRDISSSLKGVSFLDRDCWYPQAHNLISLALQRIKERKLSSAMTIKPIYLYPKECQIKAK